MDSNGVEADRARGLPCILDDTSEQPDRRWPRSSDALFKSRPASAAAAAAASAAADWKKPRNGCDGSRTISRSSRSGPRRTHWRARVDRRHRGSRSGTSMPDLARSTEAQGARSSRQQPSKAGRQAVRASGDWRSLLPGAMEAWARLRLREFGWRLEGEGGAGRRSHGRSSRPSGSVGICRCGCDGVRPMARVS